MSRPLQSMPGGGAPRLQVEYVHAASPAMPLAGDDVLAVLGFGGAPDRKSVGEGKSVSVRVDLGGRRIINNNTILNAHKVQIHQTNTKHIPKQHTPPPAPNHA